MGKDRNGHGNVTGKKDHCRSTSSNDESSCEAPANSLASNSGAGVCGWSSTQHGLELSVPLLVRGVSEPVRFNVTRRFGGSVLGVGFGLVLMAGPVLSDLVDNLLASWRPGKLLVSRKRGTLRNSFQITNPVNYLLPHSSRMSASSKSMS